MRHGARQIHAPARPARQISTADGTQRCGVLELCRADVRRCSYGRWRRRSKLRGRIHLTLLRSGEHEPLTHAHSHRQEHQGHLPRIYRQERHLPFRAGDRLRHQDGRRHLAWQRRHHTSQPAGVRHRRRSEREDRMRRQRDLRAASRRGRRDLRSDRRRNPADRLHHRGHPGARHGQGQALALRHAIAADRAELPGRHDRRRMQDRHHAGQHFSTRQGRHRVALRHAHL